MNLKTKLADNVRSGTIGAALAILVGVCLWLVQIGEPLSYDFPFVFVREVITNEVIMIKMDDASSAEFTQTSGLWDRGIHANLLDKLRRDQSKLVIFDVLFADPGENVANADLARAIKAHGNVVLAAELESMSQPGFVGIKIQLPKPEFREAAAAWGINDLVRE